MTRTHTHYFAGALVTRAEALVEELRTDALARARGLDDETSEALLGRVMALELAVMRLADQVPE